MALEGRAFNEEVAFFGRADCGLLKQVELGLSVADAMRRMGISEQTF